MTDAPEAAAPERMWIWESDGERFASSWHELRRTDAVEYIRADAVASDPRVRELVQVASDVFQHLSDAETRRPWCFGDDEITQEMSDRDRLAAALAALEKEAKK